MSQRGRAFAGQVRALATVLALATLFFLIALVALSGGFIVKRILILAAVGGAAIVLSGCSTTGQQAILQDIQTCTRDYQGTVNAGVVGGGNFTGSVKIHCDPAGTAKPATPAA
jgi:hypothetical protein